MKKLAILMFSLVMILSACGTSTTNNVGQNESIEETSGANNNNGESNEEAQDANIQESVGVFKGWADNHTIEVETDNGYVTYYITPEMQDAVNALEEGSEVSIAFFENEEGRLELQSVEAK
ncbi:hypothetical protein AB685_08070 [Bacillus sp. LL01]|uniref:hypothetical protein n=1 Tax=Bacillus sp. LL01 TaxID=1665556 RepID=UPI00064D5933|nr:hypothetical protein [Bacillus sp. LL01]KMJ59021.1 hypothetical protein AB685_08070 [Bacillus sp. LL01]